ncbi:MAG: polyphosphate polymerase domain-containing protein [Bacilli bacterium]|nr:polyphosphate polymerase domain-containing protein [Bacilli bacterium]
MNIFRRVEQKYLLTENQYNALFKEIESKIEKDKFFRSEVCNLYLDTDNNDLIIKSIEKPIYKEKVRLRSYNIPNIKDKVFLELKGKYDGVVFKRRITLKLEDFYKYLENGIKPEESQIMNEIDYVIKRNKLKPKLFLAYDRYSYYDKQDKNFRITFDTNLRSRKNDLRLESGSYGNLYKEEKFYIMELKSLKALPLWFVEILSKLKIYPQSFSKYGNIYKKGMMQNV